MNKSFAIAAVAAAIVMVAAGAPAEAGFFEDMVRALSGMDLGSGR